MLSIYRLNRTASVDEIAAVHSFGVRRLHRSLLFLGDLTEPLLGQTDVWVAWQAKLIGVAAIFHGFATTVVSVVADDVKSGMELLEEVRPALNSPSLLVANLSEPLLSCFEHEAADEDLWLLRETALTEINHPTCAVLSPLDIAAFYDRCNMHFWTPAMVNFGHYYGIRDANSTLVSLAGLNFVLSEVGYAQIGNVATDKEWRNKGFATSCVRAVINSLRNSGVSRCGLFVNAHRADLLRLYQNLGFREAGRFRFVPLTDNLKGLDEFTPRR
jgi:ribosomal protein S18 acetylase RimI-like enzyme